MNINFHVYSSGVLKIWSPESGQCVYSQIKPDPGDVKQETDQSADQAIVSAAYCPATSTVMTVTYSHNVALYDIADLTPRKQVQYNKMFYSHDIAHFTPKKQVHLNKMPSHSTTLYDIADLTLREQVHYNKMLYSDSIVLYDKPDITRMKQVRYNRCFTLQLNIELYNVTDYTCKKQVHYNKMCNHNDFSSLLVTMTKSSM